MTPECTDTPDTVAGSVMGSIAIGTAMVPGRLLRKTGGPSDPKTPGISTLSVAR